MIHFADTPSLSMAYEEHGSAQGRPIVLLHGFPYSPRAYDEVAPPLAAAGMRVIVPYLRGFGPTRFRDAERIRSGEQAALGQDLLDLIAALGLKRPLVAGYDWGGRAACVAAAIAPQTVRGLLTCAAYNIFGPPATAPLPPEKEHNLWYQYYLHGPRGRIMLTRHREEFCRYLWNIWSPNWSFDDRTFAESAEHLHNPDFVETVLHSYRHRFYLVPGDPDLVQLAAKLEQRPDITVPTLFLWSDEGLAPKPSERDRARFTGGLTYREVLGVGHSPPQEAPATFVEGVLELDAMAAA